ncbi:MAG: hypothetical protein IJ071_04530 [Ruminococcus sp.]|nr:hypothetical protein [Ruminococcus sp.]
MAYTLENIEAELDQAGVPYTDPAYAMITDLSGFFGSNRNIRYGGAAISERDTLLLTFNGLLSGNSIFELSPMGMTKLTVKKLLILPSYVADIRGMADGKKYRFKVQLNTNVGGGGFPDQQSNVMNIVNTLKKWESSL